MGQVQTRSQERVFGKRPAAYTPQLARIGYRHNMTRAGRLNNGRVHLQVIGINLRECVK